MAKKNKILNQQNMKNTCACNTEKIQKLFSAVQIASPEDLGMYNKELSQNVTENVNQIFIIFANGKIGWDTQLNITEAETKFKQSKENNREVE